jgi:hypothetical protein
VHFLGEDAVYLGSWKVRNGTSEDLRTEQVRRSCEEVRAEQLDQSDAGGKKQVSVRTESDL